MTVTYEQALAEAAKVGVSRCSDAAAMAQFCDANIQTLVGAVSPKLVWEGAQKSGITFRKLATMAGHNKRAVAELQFVGWD